MLHLGIESLSLPCSPFDPIGLPRWAAFRTFLGLADTLGSLLWGGCAGGAAGLGAVGGGAKPLKK